MAEWRPNRSPDHPGRTEIERSLSG